ncbi:MAG: hypothetical protein AUJ98_08035 [Bacteroidetes bacterium CG2_30_33_31]|nr:MAG: hypothetical protein AUJ98_08035 [Bacteroidetes bacterium CG2_30_33_31]
MNSNNKIDSNLESMVKALPGPIAIFGAGGFIGINLLNLLLKFRNDVYGISQDHLNNWRFIANKIQQINILTVDILQQNQILNFINEIKPQTIFNLAAYGAYSKQNEYDKIYQTNFVASIDLIEVAKKQGFKAFVQAGSSSEYGINSQQPSENDTLLPNSHYAVSKAALYQAIKYYGKIEKLPITNLRLYSVYGPWEEPDRLLPVVISKARKGEFPALVNPQVSRDFIYIDDVLKAFIMAALKINSLSGEALNIGSGKKTTILVLANTIKEIYKIKSNPNFGIMPNRKWDLTDWYSNPSKAENLLNWHAEIPLKDGIQKVGKWQENIDFDNAYWNYAK